MDAGVLLAGRCLYWFGRYHHRRRHDERAGRPEHVFGKLQREKFGVVAGVTFAAVGSMITFFAHLSITIFAFSKSAGLGFATLLVPLYNFVYGIKTWADNKSGIYGLIIGGIVAGLGFWLNAYSGGVQGNYFR